MDIRRWSAFLAALAVISAALPAFAADEKAPSMVLDNPDYTIGPGDLLDISVWKDEALTRVVTVLPDGRIHFPLIGDFTAAGRTVGQLKDEMKEKISTYVPDPELLVDVKQINSMLVYVIGRVNAPGRFVLNANVNVLQALSIAGGLNPYAKRNKIKIFRDEGNSTKILNFRYDVVTDGDSLEENVRLKRGDVIVVP